MNATPQPGTRTEPSISYQFVTALCDAIDEEPDIIFEGLRQFKLHALGKAVTRIPLRRYIDLFEWLSIELKRPFLGLELAQLGGPETLGAIGYMFLGSPNLEAALRNLSQYLLSVQENSRLYVEIDGEYTFVHYGILDNRITTRRQDSEYSIALTWKIIQKYTAYTCRLTMVEFEHDRPGESDGPYRRIFGAPVLFRRRDNRLHFRTEHLRSKSRAGDPNLYPILETYVQELIARMSHIESFTDQVNSHLTHDSIGRGLRAKAIASQLGISEATLHRRLGSEEQVSSNFLMKPRNLLRYY